MGKETNIIDELDFILTHPACDVSTIEKFYNNCLYIYDTVPLFVIVNHMQKFKPTLLKKWSKVNTTVCALLEEMNPREGAAEESGDVTIQVDLSSIEPTSNGIYKVTWETDLEIQIANFLLKKKRIVVVDKKIGKVDLVGFSHVENNYYNVYVKKGGK